MTAKQFYDWQTSGGTDDVTRLVSCLESKDIPWCAIGGVAVNHWADEPMVTQDVNFVVTAEDIERAVHALEEAGFKSERHQWSANSFSSVWIGVHPWFQSEPSEKKRS